MRWPSAGFRCERVFFVLLLYLVCVKRAPEARHTLAQPVRAGLKCKKIVSTVGAAPNQKHISDQTRFRVSSTTQQAPHVLPLSRRSDVKTCKRSDDLRASHRSSQSMVGHVPEACHRLSFLIYAPPARRTPLILMVIVIHAVRMVQVTNADTSVHPCPQRDTSSRLLKKSGTE